MWYVPVVKPPDQPYDKNNRSIVSLWNVYEQHLKHRSDLTLRREESETHPWGSHLVSTFAIVNIGVEMGFDPFSALESHP